MGKIHKMRAAVFALALCTAVCAAAADGLAGVRADVPSVAVSYSGELGPNGLVFFPVITGLPTGSGYGVALHETSDAGFVSPLADGLSYNFPDVGEYVLRYKITDISLAETFYTASFSIIDLTPPVMTFPLDAYAQDYSVNEEVPLLVPGLTDNNPNGNPSYTVKAYRLGVEVDISGGFLKLAELGDYTVIYAASDKSGNTATRSFTVRNTGIDLILPVITLNGQYETEYKVGAVVQIISATVIDNSGEDITAEVTAILNGSAFPIIDGAVTLTEAGSCRIIYEAADSSDNVTTVFSTFNVVDSGKENGKDENKGCGKGCSSAGAAAALAVAFIPTIIRKRGK